MQDNCNFNKTKLLVVLTKLIGKLERHYVIDAEKCNHPLCTAEYKDLVSDLKKHREKLRAEVEGLCREGKFK